MRKIPCFCEEQIETFGFIISVLLRHVKQVDPTLTSKT